MEHKIDVIAAIMIISLLLSAFNMTATIIDYNRIDARLRNIEHQIKAVHLFNEHNPGPELPTDINKRK